MKLYYTPGACSMAVHIVLCELGVPHELERVDLQSHTTENGENFQTINPKGYVPTLQLGDGQRLTEVAAILLYLAEHFPEGGLLPPAGTIKRFRIQEWLAFISSELHKSFGPMFRPNINADWKAALLANIEKRLAYVDQALIGQDYLTGTRFSIADAYLFTIVNWATIMHIDLSRWPSLQAFQKRVAARPAVEKAMRAEGLLQ